MITNILVHWAEIALKGRNRPRFIDRLTENIRKVLRDKPLGEVHRLPGRIALSAKPSQSFDEESLQRLGLVFGISSYSPVMRVPLDLEAMKEAAWRLAEPKSYETYRVTARRPFKEVPMRSQDVAIALGDHLMAMRPKKVKLKGADLDIRVEILPQGAFIYADKLPGLGGLPVGITGNVCVMLSGGIDSPVAAFRMQRRGCRATFVHFHSHPYVTRASVEKAHDLAEHLVRYQHDGTLYTVAFGEIQRQIVDTVPPPLRVILYRRFMVRIASALAIQERCPVLVTGEALAQVASQTLRNLVAIEEASPLPILRPLIGMDKMEIEAQARSLGTYETSILPDQDCCTLFTPKNPETNAKIERVWAAEKQLNVQEMVDQAVAAAEAIHLSAPWLSSPATYAGGAAAVGKGTMSRVS